MILSSVFLPWVGFSGSLGIASGSLELYPFTSSTAASYWIFEGSRTITIPPLINGTTEMPTNIYTLALLPIGLLIIAASVLSKQNREQGNPLSLLISGVLCIIPVVHTYTWVESMGSPPIGYMLYGLGYNLALWGSILVVLGGIVLYVHQKGIIRVQPPPIPTSIKCVHCSSEMPADSSFCPICGKSNESKYRDVSQQTYCIRCGRELSPEAKFCDSCGASQPAPIHAETISEENDLTAQREKITKLLEKLDETLVNGEISETGYKELKSKYSKKLKQVERSIKAGTSRKKEKIKEQAKNAKLDDSPSAPTHKEKKEIPTNVCPSCKKKIIETHRKWCPWCGTRLKSPALIICPSCKKEFEEDYGQCPWCGSRARAEAISKHLFDQPLF